MTKKLYIVMAGHFWEDASGPHSVHREGASATAMAAIIEQTDEDGKADSYAYVTEIDFYD